MLIMVFSISFYFSSSDAILLIALFKSSSKLLILVLFFWFSAIKYQQEINSITFKQIIANITSPNFIKKPHHEDEVLVLNKSKRGKILDFINKWYIF